ncbi:MAG: thiaminase II [Pseudomonadota bacterium]
MTAPSYGTAFDLLRDAAGRHWDDYVTHDFVANLADGSLPRAAFLHYLRQDYLFLNHFARAWALAVVKSETHDEMLTAVGSVNALVTNEVGLHIGICEQAGISLDELNATSERPANIAYTRYVLEAGYSGDLVDLLACLTPCVMGYGEIGLRLLDSHSNETYRHWIETYGGRDYQDLCHTVGTLLDQALTRRIGADFEQSPRWNSLCHRFETATRLEVGFWQMGLTP